MMNSVLKPSVELSLEDKRALLAEKLRKAAETETIPLSFAQQRLWFLDQLEPNSPLYNLPTLVHLSGSLDVRALQAAINQLIARHETLRTRFVSLEGTPAQVVDETAEAAIAFEDLVPLPAAGREPAARSIVRSEVNRPFNLGESPLFRVKLLRLRPDEHWLVLNLHHIISDEWSLKVLFAELTELYRAFCRGEAPSLPELPIQYADFAIWQRDSLKGELLEKQLAYWREQLRGNPPSLELPSDRPRPIVPTFNGHTVSHALPAPLSESLKEFAARHDATLFMVGLAALKALLHRYTQQEDIVVGSPIAGRTRMETEPLIGFFVNTLALRTDLSGDPTFRQLLERVREVTLEAHAHQDLPFEKLVEDLQPERSLNHLPFTGVMFAVQNGTMEELEWPGLRLRFLEANSDTAKVDLTLFLQETRDGLTVQAEYSTDLFDADSIARLLNCFETLLGGIVADPQARLSELPLLDAPERHRLLVEWNATATKYPRQCVHELFEAQAARTPDVVAVTFDGKSLTYAGLNARANQLAWHLKKFNVGPDVLVGLCVERSMEMIVGMLAILKAGGAYVPLDPAYPKERLAFMLADAQTPVLLTEQGLRERVPGNGAKVVCLDSDWDLVARESRQNLPNTATPESLAYVIYTSGSTGKPKGSAVPHRAINRLVLNTNYIRFDPSDRVAQASNASFDAATFEIWGALLNGARLAGISRDVTLSPKDLAVEIREQKISVLFLTTALFHQIAGEMPETFASLRALVFGGDAADPKFVRAVLRSKPPQQMINGYGPTETTTFSVCYLAKEVPDEATSLPIGKAISNTQLYILDPKLNPVPIGVPGELYIGGDGLARGYWNRPELTAKKFVANPFVRSADSHVRETGSGAVDEPRGQGCPRSLLYKTGDLVRWRSDGNIEFLGRIDNQVKIRGFRVEPGEIETVLSRHTSVRECVVTVRDGEGGNKRLVAYFVPNGKRVPNVSELLQFLKEKLPDYMVPSAFVPLDALPLTPNGKVDRRALPEPDRVRPNLEKRYATPRDAVEQQLTEIWEQVLGVHPIGIEDRFFDLGGHSLLAVRLIGRIEKAFGRKLRLATIFQSPTIERLAAVIREEIQEGSALAGTSLVEIQSKGTRPPLFFVHGAGGGMFWGYVNLARHLGADQPVYGLKSRGLDGRDEFERIEEMAAQYVRDIRVVQPKGPYRLGGYCFGGDVAFEMAGQLQAQGEEVALLALFNSAPPNSRYTQIQWSPAWTLRFLRNFYYWTKHFVTWPMAKKREFFRWKIAGWKNRMLRLVHEPLAAVDAENLVDLASFTPEQRKVWETHIHALLNYHPRRFRGRVHLFRSPGHSLVCSFDRNYGWGDFTTDGVQTKIVPGVHEKILEEPCVQNVAAELKRCVAAVDAAGPEAAKMSMGGPLRQALVRFGLLWAGAEGAEELVTHGSTRGSDGWMAGTFFRPLLLLRKRNGNGNGHGDHSIAARAAVVTEPSTAAAGEVKPYPMPWNDTRTEFPLDQPYPAHFEAQVRKQPEAMALRAGAEELSYAELNARANRLAHYLQSLGVGPETLVAICLERSPEFTAAMLAVMKAGGAYLPLDPSYPKERLRYMLGDSQARVLVTRSEFLADFPAEGGQRLCLDDPHRREAIDRMPAADPVCFATSDNLAYVIYTSGSTGQPKGVPITHRSLLNHNFAVARAYELKPEDRVLQFGPFSFDISVEELFPTWLSGGAVVLRTDDSLLSPARLLEFAARERLTVLNLPTAFWHELVEQLQTQALPASLRLVVIGGEKASDEAWRRWKERAGAGVTLINTYGPTETTVIATLHVGRPEDDSLPIGRPIANMQAFVLDADRRLVAVGETGELYLGGIGVSRGYLGRPELTAERFVPNPFVRSADSFVRESEKSSTDETRGQGCPRSLLYKTGDLVRLRPDGELEFVGRADEQVKIRGFRIEPGEIEAALRAHPDLKDAVVVAREDQPGKKKLAAYFVPRGQNAPNAGDLLQFLKGTLPAYMVPSSFVHLEALPLTPAGKVDRRALPAPGGARPELNEKFIEPRTPLEEAIAGIWCEVLGLNRVGVHDNFFDLGGHSLLATQVLSRIREVMHVEIPLAAMFAAPTVAALVERLPESLGQTQPVLPAAVTRGERLPLTIAQRRIWFLDQFEPRQSSYNIPTVVRLKGALNLTALERSLSELASRHEALRAVFPAEDGQPVQIICEPKEIQLTVTDLSHLPEEQRESRALSLAGQESGKSYIMSSPMLRPGLLRLGAEEHWLLFTTHEIACDARSVRLLLEELAALYGAFANGQEPSLPPTSARYAETLAQFELPAEAEAEQLAYWKQRFEGAPALLDLPADRPRRAHQPDDGARLPIRLPADLAIAAEKLGEGEQCTPFVTLLAVFQTLLARYTGNGDIVVGSRIPAGRRAEWAGVVARLENFIALRADLSGDPAFRELLGRVREAVSGAIAHGVVPFGKVLEELRPERNASYTPVFQVMFQLEEAPLPEFESAGVRFSPFEVDNFTAKHDLKLSLARTADGLSGWVEYSTALFDRDRIGRLMEHFETLLRAVVQDPAQAISTLPLMNEREARQVLVEWNATAKEYPRTATLVDLVEAQAARTPDATALIAGTERLTFADLNARADELAARLRALGVGPGTLVGICLERSWRLIAGILGVLKAGGAYVPMDPAYPKDRLAFILEDTRAPVLLTQESLRGIVAVPEGTHVLCVDAAQGPKSEIRNPKSEIAATDLAYVIYTSGSTGKPKGVMLEHRNAVSFVCWAKDVFSREELAGVLASTSVCFDLSIFEIFVPLSWGGTVILAENALALPSLPAAKEVTMINTVPSAIRELLRAKGVPPGVRVVNLAGEPLATPLVNQIYEQTRVEKVYDLYGPSETTTYSTFTLRRPDVPATIGKPLANEQVYLLDRNRQPVPIGVPGEIYIGGDGVARGYLNRPELTAEKFVANPLVRSADSLVRESEKDSPNETRGQGCPRSLLYRTGDLARWRADGNLEFLGRIDHQVKIRGFRIELGEIETVLRKHPGVREGVVLAREDQPGDKRLVAYLEPKPGQQLTVEELRTFAREWLPEYMVPAIFVFLPALPLTPNGKVNRKALPAPDLDRRDGRGDFVAPRSPVEEQLGAIWREVLRLERVGVRDNFFELGGHSLMALQVISRVRDSFKVELPLFSLFDAPTIESLAKGLASGEWTRNQLPVLPLLPVSRDQNLPVSFVQERLWFLDQLEPGNHAYNIPVALRFKGALDAAALQRSLDGIVQRHEALRTTLVYRDGALTQQIAAASPVKLSLTDLQSVAADAREARAQELINREAQRPFDLERGPLLRVSLVRLEERDHLFLVVMHHTVSDGWSLTLFFQELELLYHAFAAGQAPPELPELLVQYADFAAWKRQWMRDAVLDQELAYWEEKLKGAPASVNLPCDHPQPAAGSGAAARRTLPFPKELADGLMSMAQHEGATPFMVFMAALTIAFQKWAQQSDLVIGTVVAGRNRREIENVIGCFMNFLPIRTQVAGGETGRQLLARVKAAVLEAQAHQDCPFEKIVETINPERRLNQNPLYNVALLLQNFPEEMLKSETLSISPAPVEMHAPLLDLRFEAEQTEHSLSLVCEYKTDLFEAATIEALLASYRDIIETLARNPDAALSEFKLTDELASQAKSARGHQEEQTLAIAATFTAEPVEEALRYWMKELELPARVQFAPFNQVFQQLLDPGSLLGTNTRGLNVVLVRLEDWLKADGEKNAWNADDIERGAREFISTATAAAGRAGAPLLTVICPASPGFTPERRQALEQIETFLAGELERAGGIHVVRPGELLGLYPVADYYDASGDELGRVPYTPVFFTALGTLIARRFHALQRAGHKVIVLDCDNTLWAGVCGEDGPKGICLDPPRKALQEFMRAQLDAGMLLATCSKNNEEDVHEVFAQRLDMPLRREHFTAWRLNWLPKSENLKSLAAELNLGLDSFIFIDDNPVECAEVEANCPDVLVLQLPEDPAEFPRFLKHCWAFDRLKVTAEDRRRGQMYRENEQREQLRSKAGGLAGFIAGLDLRIAIAPMSPEQVARVSQLTHRTNQFNCTTLRRSEAEIQQVAGSAEVLTVSVRDRFGDYGLVGVMICEPRGETLDVETFLLSCRVLGRGVEHAMLAWLGRRALEQKLPWVNVHFHPSAKNKPALDFLQSAGAEFKQPLNGGFVYLFPSQFAAEIVFNPEPSDAFATDTASTVASLRKESRGGRITRFACRAIALKANDPAKIHQAIEAQAGVRSGKEAGYVAPTTERERQLCAIMEKLLHIERVGIRDNFFELGGHSLLAVRLFAELEKLSGRKLPLVTIFQAPTAEQLAAVLDDSAAHRSPLFPVQPNGTRPPLFLVHGAGGDILWGYGNLAKHMPNDQPIYGIKSRGQIGLEEFDCLEAMARYYLEEVQALQPQGPYYLGGYCFGGNVAYEMARQLRARGEQVAFVALIDASPSNAGYEKLAWWRPTFLFRFARNLHYWLADFRQLDFGEQRRFIGRKTRALGRKIAAWFRRQKSVDVDLEDVIDLSHFPEHELKYWRIHLRALVTHRQQPYDGAVTLVRTRGQPLFCSFEEDFCWSKVAGGGVEVKCIPGSHENIFMEPNVKFLAAQLEECLAQARLAHPPATEIQKEIYQA